MGVNDSIYLGPHVECKSHYKKLNIYPNCKLNPQPDDCPLSLGQENKGYCQICGKNLSPQIRLQKDPTITLEELDAVGLTTGSSDDLYDCLEDALKKEIITNYIPNKKYEGNCWYNHELETASIDLTNINAQEEINKFKSAFEDGINLIIERFGENNIKFKFGQLIWFN